MKPCALHNDPIDNRFQQEPNIAMKKGVSAAPTPGSGKPSAKPSAVKSPARAVVSAARSTSASSNNTAKPALSRAAIEASAADTVLNAFSILGEVIEDFKNADRFFKYKAGVLTTWLLLTVLSFAIACPGGDAPSNRIDAHLVIAGEAARPIYMIRNDSDTDWNQVEISVNGGRFKGTLSQLKGNGGSFTLSGAVLYTDDGTRAPSNLAIEAIDLKVYQPSATVPLLRNGTPTKVTSQPAF
jgi:hypothetical protein